MRRNLVLGSTLTPLIAAIAYQLLLLSDRDIGKYYTIQEMIHGFILGVIPVSYAVCIVLGAPLVYLLKRRQQLRFWTVTAASGGVALGALCILFIVFLATNEPDWQRFQWRNTLTIVVVASGFGAFVGGVFCMLSGITRRP